MKATHYYPDDISFYESWYVVQEGEITHYKNKGSVWCKPNPENKYERFPKVEDLQGIE